LLTSPPLQAITSCQINGMARNLVFATRIDEFNADTRELTPLLRFNRI